jgi:ABC-type multidrug transport system fused ATPase/permease subunit
MTTYFDTKIVVIYLLAQVIINQMDVYCQHYLGKWSQDETMSKGLDNILAAAGWYVVLRMTCAVFNVIDVKTFWMLTGGVNDTLRKQLLEKIMNAPTSFFDTTPHATIMSRFNDDTRKLIGIVHTVSFAVDQTIRVGTTLYLICTVNPICLIGIAIFCFMVK